MTYEDLKNYVGSNDDQYVIACFEEAEALLDAFIGDTVVPQPIKDRCVLDIGGRLYSRKSAQDGVAQYSTEGAPVFIARDPLVGVYPILARYMVMF